MTEPHQSYDVAAPSSTPLRSDNAIFSDNLHPARPDTPPSSPPAFPWDVKHEIENVVPTNSMKTEPWKNVFSVLGKRKPLAATSDNARPRKQQKPVDAKPLTQMQMSLGQKIQTKCKLCGMEYVASSAEDRKLHDRFHKQSTEGCDVGKNFVSSTHKGRLFGGVKSGDSIVELDCSDHGRRRKIGQVALGTVQRELGAVPIPNDIVWDSAKQSYDWDIKYRSYLYIRGTKCIGYLLAESIQEAYHVIRPDTVPVPKDTTGNANHPEVPKNALEALRARKRAAEQAQEAVQHEIEDAANYPIQISKTKHSAVLGVSRIWTSSTHRGQGIAACLVNTAIKCCNTRFEAEGDRIRKLKQETKLDAPEDGNAKNLVLSTIPKSRRQVKRKEQVAFSQPTDSGAKLARKWFGKAYGWSVYVD